ncbi:MAG: hypothetical protein COX16_01280 [Deltaproteobacteria bacterium CG23_combo_of_CG06-09_8_20_14_all_51_20]|nr:MAG: hypothetical protein COX16_01280 [Deltaproteobacteria bacterium CG23_combo_of_CG06-09_8_20_14_all_51_20]
MYVNKKVDLQIGPCIMISPQPALRSLQKIAPKISDRVRNVGFKAGDNFNHRNTLTYFED